MQISVLGTVLNIETDESREYMDVVLGYLNGKIDEIERTLPVKDPLRKSIIANILIIDELFKAEKRSGSAPDDTGSSSIADRIIARIDEVLGE